MVRTAYLHISERLAKGGNDSRKAEISNNERKQSAGNKNVVIIFFDIGKCTWTSSVTILKCQKRIMDVSGIQELHTANINYKVGGRTKAHHFASNGNR